VSTSKDGTLLTTIRDLARRRGRERRGLALAEGIRLVEEALAAGTPVRGAAVSPALEGTPRGQALKLALAEQGVRLVEVSLAELDALADTEHPQGVVAVVEPRVWSLADVPTAPGAVVLVLDAVQDPGNVGTMLRTALGLGAAGVVALKGTAELINPKVLRGSMGAAFRLPAVAADAGAFLAWLAEHGVELWIAAADGEPVSGRRERARRPPLALALGNEGAGVSATIAAAARRRVAIPLAPGVESLNVAVAAGILLHEVMRDA
jgi:RNA methyltransferase, TrmH family